MLNNKRKCVIHEIIKNYKPFQMHNFKLFDDDDLLLTIKLDNM